MIRRLLCRLTGHDMVVSHLVFTWPISGDEQHTLTERCLRCGEISRQDVWIYKRVFDHEHQEQPGPDAAP